MMFVSRRARCVRIFALGCVAFAGLGISLPRSVRAESGPEGEVSLTRLLAFAERRAPELQLVRSRRAYADAARRGAEPWLRDNPSLEVALGPRFAAGATALDLQVSLTQSVEIAGEPAFRRRVAARLGERIEAELSAARAAVRREVSLAFYAAVLARERLALAQRLVQFADGTQATTRRRLDAGDATAIDALIAQTDAAQARQAELAAEQELRAARITLADVTGWPLDAPPQVPAEIVAARPPARLDRLLRLSQQRHPELRARRAASAEAHARVELADREAWPAPTLGAHFAHEGSASGPSTDIVLGSLEVPLPLWDREQGERAQRRAEEGVARAEESVASRALRARIARAHSELTMAFGQLELFRTSVSTSLGEGLGLLERGFQAGELSLSSVVAARERLLQGEQGALRAYADYFSALIELESAVGTELSEASAAPSPSTSTPTSPSTSTPTSAQAKGAGR